MLRQFSERSGSLVLHCRIVIHIFERIIPRLVRLIFRLPDIPGIACISEDRDLAGLRLLHRVEHDALDLRRIHARVEERRIPAHDQVVLRIVCTRPVDPHVRSAACSICKCLCKAVAYFSPDPSAGHNDLHVLRELLIIALSVVHIFYRTERKGLLQVRILLAHLSQPLCHIIEETDIVVRPRIRCVVRQDRHLSYTGFDHLLELRLDDREVFLIMLLRVKPDRIVHECMERKYKPALRFIARIRERFDQCLDLLIRIKCPPLCVVLRIVLRCVEIGIQFVVSSPFHQVDPVLRGPRIPVVSFDKSAARHIRPVFDMEASDRLAVHLLHDVVQRCQSVEARVCIRAEDCDHIFLTVQDVGIQLVEKSVRRYLHVFLCVLVNVSV